MTTEQPSLILPALRGIMGDWVYYCTLMDLKTLEERVEYADNVHQHSGLSTMIQRRLDDTRRNDIAEYLRSQPQRFFNSLVVATYGGDPNWISLSSIESRHPATGLDDLSQEAIGSVGFLVLRGDEQLFALDGQHRLAGIRHLTADDSATLPEDEVSVIMVSHALDEAGLERTRRLFTTLNKTARRVSKGDIIALDEDDVMAICVRRLVETGDLFSGNRLAFVATNNMPHNNTESLTTIGNLYDILTILFTKSHWELRKRKSVLQRVRPPDYEVDDYFQYAATFFDVLREEFSEVREFVEADDSSEIVRRYRGAHGGKVVFRPLGLDAYASVVAILTEEMSLEDAVRRAARLPRDLTNAPFEGVLWDSRRGIIVAGSKVLLREVLAHMCGARGGRRMPTRDLLERYQRAIGDQVAQLPEQME